MIREQVIGSYFIILTEMFGALSHMYIPVSFSDKNNILRNLLFAILPVHDNYRIGDHI